MKKRNTGLAIHLILQYYLSGREDRQRELDECLQKNLDNPFIARVHLLTEETIDLSHLHNYDKIAETVIGERLTYEKAFHYANAHAGQDELWILANADIYFDESLRYLADADMKGKVFALTRHDIQKDGSLKLIPPVYGQGTQDAWIFRPPMTTENMFSGFRLGIPGCDSRIAYELVKAGYRLANPSKKIILRHLDLTREIDPLKRAQEYRNLNTAENIKAGNIAAPPHYYVFPTNALNGIYLWEEIKKYVEIGRELMSRGKAAMNTVNGERRTSDQLREAYEIEKELSLRLRNANKEERKKLYNAAYDEWYNRVLHDRYLGQKSGSDSCADNAAIQIRMLMKFLRPDRSFLEVGPGDCSVLKEIAKVVKNVYAVDVSSRAAEGSKLPGNVTMLISDGCSIPLLQESIHMAYSNQLMEHLHPEDAFEQLCNIYNVLTPDGMYLCITPNRLYGPHDISQYFDDIAAGLHLKEYTVTELEALFKRAGFSTFRLLLGARGRYVMSPTWPVRWMESLLGTLPYRLSRTISFLLPVRVMLGIKLIAMKQSKQSK